MAQPGKTQGGPPNFYTAMAGMSPQPGAPSASSPASPPPGGGASGEKVELASRFFKLAEKWAKTGKAEQTYAQRVMDVIKEYWTNELKRPPGELASGADSASSPSAPPSGGGGAGASDSGALPPPGSPNEGTQPVPA